MNLDISLKDLLSNPLLCTKRDTVSLLLGHYKEDQAAIDQMTTPSSDPNFVYYTHRSFGRNVTCQVDLLMGLKEFYELDQSDQVGDGLNCLGEHQQEIFKFISKAQ